MPNKRILLSSQKIKTKQTPDDSPKISLGSFVVKAEVVGRFPNFGNKTSKDSP